jgi:hypothetical protein
VSTEGDGLGVPLDAGLGMGGGAVAFGSVEDALAFEQAASPAPTAANRTARRLIRSI